MPRNRTITPEHFIVFVLITCLSLAGRTGYGQKMTIRDTVQVNELMKITGDSISANAQKCLELSERALQISKEIGYTLGVGRSLNSRGEALVRLGKYDLAIKDHLEAIRIGQKYHFKRTEAAGYLNLMIPLEELGRNEEAFKSCQKATKLFEDLNDTVGIGWGYIDLANVMFDMGFNEDAITFTLKGAGLFRAIHKLDVTAFAYSSVAAVYQDSHKYKEALVYLRHTISLSDSVHNAGPLPLAFLNLGVCYEELGLRDSASYFYRKAYDGFEINGDMSNKLKAIFNIGSLYYSQGKVDSAKKYHQMAYDLSAKIQHRDMEASSLRMLAKIANVNGDYKKAFEFRDKAADLKDSLLNAGKVKELAALTKKFEIKEAEQKNLSLETQNSLQKIKLQRKDILLYGSAVLLILLSGTGFLLFRHRKLRANQKLMELEQKQLLAQINPHFIFNCLNSIQQFVVQNDTMNANRYLADFAMLMRQTLDNSKDGIISLKREIEYLENYLSFEHMRFEDKFTYTLTCQPEIDIDNIEIPSMIIQPFVENAIRHGICNLEARNGILSIRFHKKDGFLFCEIDDNGIGLEESRKIKAQAFIKYQSHGMELTTRRLALVSKMQSADYNVTISDRPGIDGRSEGTHVVIKFPLLT